MVEEVIFNRVQSLMKLVLCCQIRYFGSSECNIFEGEQEHAQPYLLFQASDPDTPKKHQNVS